MVLLYTYCIVGLGCFGLPQIFLVLYWPYSVNPVIHKFGVNICKVSLSFGTIHVFAHVCRELSSLSPFSSLSRQPIGTRSRDSHAPSTPIGCLAFPPLSDSRAALRLAAAQWRPSFSFFIRLAPVCTIIASPFLFCCFRGLCAPAWVLLGFRPLGA